MEPDHARRSSIQEALREAGLDALVCSLPANVLLVSGYWPVVGTGVAVVARGGPTVLLVPEDEQELAGAGYADEVRTFRPGSLELVSSTARMIHGPLEDLARELSLRGRRVGYEARETFEPSSYAAMHLYGAGIMELLERTFIGPSLEPADDVLGRLRSRKTPREVERIRAACSIAGQSFQTGAGRLQPGLKETEAAALFQGPLAIEGVGHEGVQRAGGFAFCMSGPNSARAHGAYARSRDRKIGEKEPVLVHCNSYADGYWTDITRTYFPGGPDARWQEIAEAVFAARAAALAALCVGARAAAVDRAAREVLEARGFGKGFKHSTGHGVGFAAINHNARPRLHPASEEVLEEGMVFNVEPAVYIEGQGGLRHCDVVALTAQGPKVLTPFQGTLQELTVR